MSEEEKKAIDLLKSEILDSEKLFEEVGCYKFFNKDRINAVKVILNLVENNNKAIKEQQKEIEELKELLQGNLYEKYDYYRQLAGSYQANSISKDKIRDLIKDLEKLPQNQYIHLSNIISGLMTLLEE